MKVKMIPFAKDGQNGISCGMLLYDVGRQQKRERKENREEEQIGCDGKRGMEGRKVKGRARRGWMSEAGLVE